MRPSAPGECETLTQPRQRRHVLAIHQEETYTQFMADVTEILSKLEAGDLKASEELLPLVYDELRRLAAAKMAQERPGQTLQATALVHEAYVNLVDVERVQRWDSRGHFFKAAAEAMRRILIQRYRHKTAEKRGGGMKRMELADADIAATDRSIDMLALSEALGLLAEADPAAADLAKLRIFAGLSLEDAAEAMALPRTTAYRNWTYAQAWLRAKLADVQ